METVSAGEAIPPRAPSRFGGLPAPDWLPAAALGFGCVLSSLAFFLPWQHITAFNSGVPGNYETANLPVSTTLVPNPGYTIADLLFASAFHGSLAEVFASVLWQAALPLVGVALLLAFFSWRARWLRWPLLAAFALWSALLGIIGANFLVTLRFVSTASYAEVSSHPPTVNWWTRLIAVGGIYGGQTTGPAWGWYVLWVGLALAGVGIVWSALRLRRNPADAGCAGIHRTTGVHRMPLRISARRQRIAIALCTVAFVAWAAALLALPLATIPCGVANVTNQCLANANLYALQAEAIAPLLTTVVHTSRLGDAELGVLIYMRTFVLLALTLAAAPFALLAVWRTAISRWRAVACAVWGVLVLVVTWTVVFSALVFISPQHTPGSSFSVTTAAQPAVAFFVMPLAALALIAGLALRWLPWPRDGHSLATGRGAQESGQDNEKLSPEVT